MLSFAIQVVNTDVLSEFFSAMVSVNGVFASDEKLMPLFGVLSSQQHFLKWLTILQDVPTLLPTKHTAHDQANKSFTFCC